MCVCVCVCVCVSCLARFSLTFQQDATAAGDDVDIFGWFSQYGQRVGGERRSGGERQEGSGDGGDGRDRQHHVANSTLQNHGNDRDPIGSNDLISRGGKGGIARSREAIRPDDPLLSEQRREEQAELLEDATVSPPAGFVGLPAAPAAAPAAGGGRQEPQAIEGGAASLPPSPSRDWNESLKAFCKTTSSVEHEVKNVENNNTHACACV